MSERALVKIKIKVFLSAPSDKSDLSDRSDIGRIRACVAEHGHEMTFAELIDEITALGFNGERLAALMGERPARVSEARNGKARNSFKLKFAELFGEGGN